MFLEILGSPQLHIADKHHSLTAKRPCLLLSYLAYRQEAVSRDELLALFWPEKSERDARHSMRQLVYRAKKEVFGEALLVTDDKLSIDVLSDVSEFKAALDKEDWAKALELYKGEFLKGFLKDNSAAVEHWLTLTRHDLKNSWHYAVLKRSSELTAKKDFDASILNLQKALEKDELSEELLQALLHVQMQAGQFQEARQDYEKFCFRLEQELDLEPTEQTQEVFKTIVHLEKESIQLSSRLNSEVTDSKKLHKNTIVNKRLFGEQAKENTLDLNELLTEAPPSLLQQPNEPLTESLQTKTLNNSYNKASALTPFVGRTQELAKLTSFISSPEQILTITGAGGMGKTRLAEQFLIEQAHTFRHGSINVPLTSIWISDAAPEPEASVQSIEAIATAIAYAIDLKLLGTETVKVQVLTAIKDKELLILLDNFEQLQQVASFVVELANAAPQSKIVVTSRVLLGLAGEMVYDLQGLVVPNMPKVRTSRTPNTSTKTNHLEITENKSLVQIEDYDAIALFLANARRMNKPLVLDEDTQSFVINICQILEGIPLAIELAATWLRLLSLPLLHKELCKGFSVLSSVSSNVDCKTQRHHSLRTVFDYSWSLISPSQQTVLAKLAVFQSPFSLEAAQSVTGSSLIDLLVLVNSSLLKQDESDHLSIHKFTHEYLELKLQEMPSHKEEAEEAYKQYYVTWLAELRDGFHNHKEQITIGLIEKSENNVNVVWGKIVQAKDQVSIDQAMYSIVHYYEIKGLYKEGNDKASQAYTSLIKLNSELNGKLIATTQNELSSPVVPKWLNVQTSSLARTLAKLLIYRGRFHIFLKNQKEAFKLCEEGLLLEKLTRPYLKEDTEYLMNEIAAGNVVLGMIYGGNKVSSISYISKSLEMYQKLECDSGIGDCYNHLGSLNLELGNYKKAEQYFLKSIDIQKDLGNLRGLAKSLRSIGVLAMYQKDFAVSNDYMQQSLNVYIQMNDMRGQLFAMSVIGDIAYRQKNYTSAERFFLQALALQEANDIQPDVYLMLNLGLVAAKNHDTDKAVSFFLQACKTDMNSFDQVELVLHIGITFMESWQQEDKAAILLDQVIRNPTAIADHQKVAEENFELLSESAKSKALSKQRDFQEVFEQMIEDLTAMQRYTQLQN